MNYLNEISKKLVNEDVESILEKAYCSVLFTSTYVIKLFGGNKREYDEKALQHEYLWDKSMPYLSARFVESIEFCGINISALILRRIPNSANMLYKLICNEIVNKEILQVGNLIKNLVFNFQKIEVTPETLYKNYISNLDLQITELNGKLELSSINILRKLCNSHGVLQVFKETEKNSFAALIHGNLFSGNIFYYQNELIVIDPISYNHIARKSFPHMDLAAFLVDVRLLKSYSDYLKIYIRMTSGLSDCEILLTQLYFFLKLLVRLRFSYMEKNLYDEYFNVNINEIIILNGKKVIFEETEHTLNLLKKFL